MKGHLSSMIQNYEWASKTVEEKDSVATNELANIRTDIRSCNPDLLPRLIAKLVYLNMAGRQTSFGQLQCINLMSDERFSYKRIGYLGASVLLDENAELNVLITHTLEKDLQSKHKFVVALALSLVANLGSVEICRSLATQIQKLLEYDDPFLKKRVAMAIIRIIKKIPEFSETFQPHVHILLNDQSHSVVLSGIGIVIEMLKAAPNLSQNWSRFSSSFVKILKSLNNTSKSIGESTDPFLQVKILEILELLKSPSDDLDEVLASIISSIDIKRSDGKAILLQAVQTIVAIGKKPSLRTLAFNQIGKLLSFQDSNLLYSALNVFSRVLYANRDILDRTGSDALALQRYKVQIVRCLDNPDISIRRRALDVISALIDSNNAKQLVPEITKYLHYADSDFRAELVSRIFAAIQRFSPNEQWNFDSILQILKESGGYVKSDIISSVCQVVSRSQSMQYYAVSKLLPIIQESSTIQSLVQVGSWILGEYGTYSEELEKTFNKILKLPQTSRETKTYILTALAKLGARSQNNQTILNTLQNESKNNNLDIQQRSHEFYQILTQTNQAESILSPAPPYEQESEETIPQTKQNTNIDNWMQTEEEPQVNSSNNLLEDLLGDIISPTNNNNNTPITPESKRSNDLLDLGISMEPQQVKPKISIKLPEGAEEAFNSDDLQIFFEVKKTPGNPNMVAIRSSSFNKSSVKITNYSLNYSAPEGWVSQIQPPSGNEIEPHSSNPILQISYWKNNGAQTPMGIQYKPLSISLHISYIYGSMPYQQTYLVPQKIFQ